MALDGDSFDDDGTLKETIPFLMPDQAESQPSTPQRRSLQDFIIITPPDTTNAQSGLKQRLYISHFLSTWNSRVFEFGAVLFLANIFPDTLLPSSIYALVRAASAICFSPAIGSAIDRMDRLAVVRFSIGRQPSISFVFGATS